MDCGRTQIDTISVELRSLDKILPIELLLSLLPFKQIKETLTEYTRIHLLTGRLNRYSCYVIK